MAVGIAGGGDAREPRDEDLSAAPTRSVSPHSPVQPRRSVSRLFAAGQLVGGRYRVIRFIARGGMGEVYEADDLDLHVRVALKTIRPDIQRDASSLERLRREVLLARSVSHVNVCRIFDLGTHRQGADSDMFLSMELLAGETLSERLRRCGRLGETQARVLGSQLALGLAAAHEARVVHRDFKSGNVMLVPGSDGERAVITDFGLAHGPIGDPSGDGSTGGGMAGTAAYMAPEQAHAVPVGPAADIYALGIVLYEMVTGELPFRGDSPLSAFAKRLVEDPKPPCSVVPELDTCWDATILRCLQRDPAKRFARAIQVAESLSEDRAPTASDAFGGRVHLTAARVRWRRRGVVAGAGAGLLLAGSAVYALIARRVPEARDAALVGTPIQLTRGEGWERTPAVSPDGSLVAYVAKQDGQIDLWLVEARGGEPMRLTDDAAVEERPAWFPDGTAVVFTSNRGGARGLWRVPRLGGPATPLGIAGGDASISPDGTRVAFARADAEGLQRILVAPLAEPARAVAWTGFSDGFLDHGLPGWSPDGRGLTYQDFSHAYVVDSEGATPRRVMTGRTVELEPSWSSDGRSLLFVGIQPSGRAIWRVSAAGGAPERLTLGTGPETEPSVSRDGSRLAYSTYYEDPQIVLIDRATGVRTEVAGSWSEEEPRFLSDASGLVFESRRTSGAASSDVYLQPLAGGVPSGPARRVSSLAGGVSWPAPSPDGRWVAVMRNIDDARDLYILPMAGGEAFRLTDDPGVECMPAWSPDGSRLVYVSRRDHAPALLTQAMREGRPVGAPVTLPTGSHVCASPAWSPDGSAIAYAAEVDGHSEVWRIAADGSAPPVRLTHGADAIAVEWEADGRSLLASGRDGGRRATLRKVPAGGGPSEPLDLPIELGDTTYAGLFALAPGGRSIAAEEERIHGHVWIVDSPPGTY